MTYEELQKFTDWWESIKPLAEKIAYEIEGCEIDNIFLDGDRIGYTYNGACNCHPEDETDYFDAELLFDPDPIEKIRDMKAEQAAARAIEAEREKQEEEKRKEARERKQYEELKAKFEPKQP